MSQSVEQEYYCIMANSGMALEAAAHAKGVPVVLSHIAVGDGNGQVPAHTQRSAALVHEVYRREIDSRRVDDEDKNIVWISMLIPADTGGFWIREFAVYARPLDEGGEPVLYAIGTHAPYYKTSKILGQATTHQLEVPIIMSGAAEVEIQVRDAGYALQSELLALQSELDRLKKLFSSYHPLCSLHLQLEPDLKEGFEAWDGGVIENAARMYPEAWQYLQTSEGQKRCIDAAGRQALREKVYYTLADGTELTYGGIGGQPFYTLDMATGTLTMPDIRGQHLEVAGFDSLNVASCAIDAVRDFTSPGQTFMANFSPYINVNSFFYITTNDEGVMPARAENGDWNFGGVSAKASNTTPVSAVTRPRSFGVLACAYLGQPAL